MPDHRHHHLPYRQNTSQAQYEDEYQQQSPDQEQIQLAIGHALMEVASQEAGLRHHREQVDYPRPAGLLGTSIMLFHQLHSVWTQGLNRLDAALSMLPGTDAAPQDRTPIGQHLDYAKHAFQPLPAGQYQPPFHEEKYELTETASAVLQESIFERLAELKTLLGDDFFNVISKEAQGNQAKKIALISEHFLNLSRVVHSINQSIRNKIGDSDGLRMIVAAQKFEQYTHFVSESVSEELHFVLSEVMGKDIWEKFDNEYSNIYLEFSKQANRPIQWTTDFPLKVFPDTFNEALKHYRAHEPDIISIDSRNARYLPYFEGFRAAETSLNSGSSPDTSQALSEIQSAYRLVKTLSKTLPDITLPVNAARTMKSLETDLANEKAKKTPGKERIKDLRESMSCLSQAMQENEFTWLLEEGAHILSPGGFWKNERINDFFVKSEFPSPKEIAADLIREEILKTTGLRINPNLLMLHHFKRQDWNNGQLEQSQPIARDSADLPTWMLSNFNMVIRDNIAIDDNSWGIYPSNAPHDSFGTYRPGDKLAFSPTAFVNLVIKTDFYHKVYLPRLDAYWRNISNVKSEELKNVMRLTATLKESTLSQNGQDILMAGLGLRENAASPVTASLFDIKNYPATDMLVLKQTRTGKLVLYLPRHFIAREFSSDRAMRNWVINTAGDSQESQKILDHFPLEEQREGVVLHGVRTLLQGIASGEEDPGLVWKKRTPVTQPVIEAITENQKERLYQDAHNLIKTNTDVEIAAWVDYLAVVNNLMGNPLTILLSMALDSVQIYRARDDEELAQAKSRLGSDTLNLLLMAAMDGAMRVGEPDIAAFQTTEFIKRQIADPVELGNAHRDLMSGSRGNFIAPIKVKAGDLERLVPQKYRGIYKNHNNDFYIYHDPLTAKKIYLVYDDILGHFYDVDTNIRWQPRHYDAAEINSWETGIDGQAYASLDQFDAGDTSANLQEVRSLESRMEQGHYIAPIEVTQSKGRFKIVRNFDAFFAANGMRMNEIPYEIISTSDTILFSPEEDYTASRAPYEILLEEKLKQFQPEIKAFQDAHELSSGSISERSAAEANAMLKDLDSLPEITDKIMSCVIYWSKPENGQSFYPTTRFFIRAKYQERDIIIDPSVHWFDAEARVPVVSSDYRWTKNIKNTLGKRKDLLAKIAFYNSDTDEILSFFEKKGPFDPTNAFLLYRPDWYSEEYFETIKSLEQKSSEALIASRRKNLGPADTNGVAILTQFESQSGLSIHQKEISDRFLLYRTSEGTGEVLLLTAHGGYFMDSGEVPIPEDLTLSFLGPHARPLWNPGLGLIHDDSWLPFAELGRDEEVLYRYKNKPRKDTPPEEAMGTSDEEFKRIPHEDVKGDPQMIYGADSAGLVKNYWLDNYNDPIGSEENRTYNTETPQLIAKAIDENRIKKSLPKTDVLTVRTILSGRETQLSDVFDLLQTHEELKTYKKLIFSACRVDSEIGPSPKGYAIKGKQIVMAEKTPAGWAIKGIVPVPAPVVLDNRNKHSA